MNREKIMFDTNCFNQILDKKISISTLKLILQRYEIFITHLQEDEINNCKDENRKKILKLKFEKVKKEFIPTKGFVLGISKMKEDGTGGTLSEDYSIYEKIKNKCFKKKKRLNGMRDGLIGNTSIKNNLTLITNDSDLMDIVNKLGGTSYKFEALIEKLREKKLYYIQANNESEICEFINELSIKEIISINSGVYLFGLFPTQYGYTLFYFPEVLKK
jgi:hypothetical protein